MAAIQSTKFNKKAITSWLELRFQDLWETVSISGEPSAKIHQDMLATYRVPIRHMVSELTCLCCLARMPERQLTCGCYICDTCIQIQRKILDDPHTYTLPNCFLCAAEMQGLRIELKPPTARFEY